MRPLSDKCDAGVGYVCPSTGAQCAPVQSYGGLPMWFFIIPPTIVMVALLGLFLSNVAEHKRLSVCFSRASFILFIGLMIIVVILGIFVSVLMLYDMYPLPMVLCFAVPWILVILGTVISNLVYIIRLRHKKEGIVPQKIANRANKWFLLILVAILLLGTPLYWDWNVNTSSMGYSFQRTDPRSWFLMGAGEEDPRSAVSVLTFATAHQSYQVTNNSTLSPFEDRIITFRGRNHLHFDGEFFEYYVQHRSFGIWYDIIIIPTYGYNHLIENISRYDFGRIERGLAGWYHREYVIAAAIMNIRMVRSVGFINNFFQVIRTPTLALLAVYAIYNLASHRKSAITSTEENINT